MNTSAPGEGRGGFALVMVVFLLFAVAVAAATGYQVVSSEFVMARQNRDGLAALGVARAGLQRYLGETVGVVGDSVSYAIGNGIAVVTARKVLEKDTLNHLYYIRSEGQVDDPRFPLLPARRTVATYAWHRLNPIPPTAALLLTGGPAYLFTGASISGADHASSSDCTFGGTVPRYGLGIAGSIFGFGGTYSGVPSGSLSYPNHGAVYDAVGVRWDILSNPSFPVDFHNTWPNFSALPADSFPIVRYTGNFTAWGSVSSGRGVLIVTGELVIRNNFVWDGIILAGRFYAGLGGSTSRPQVNGMLVGGLNAANNISFLSYTDIRYHSCNVYKANRSLSYLEVVDGSFFEVNG